MSGPRVKNIAIVEVRKNAESTTWYDAFLQDFLGETVVVAFENSVWPKREVPCSSARPRPAQGADGYDGSAAAEVFTPGSLAEVRVAASERNPHGWALAHVKVAMDDCVHVELEGVRPGLSRELVVLASAVRPLNGEPTLNVLRLSREALPVDPALHSWLSTSDARGCIEQVRDFAGLAHAGPGTVERGIVGAGLATTSAPLPQPDSVVFIGDVHAVRRAAQLMQIHSMHQKEVEAFHERRRRKLQLLKDMQDKLASMVAQASFEIRFSLVGRMLGKGGENVRRVEAAHGVEVRILDSTSQWSGNGASAVRPMTTVRISGETEEAVSRARDELEVIDLTYRLEQDMAEWALGRGHRETQELARKTGLVSATWDEDASVLRLVGTRETLADAKLLLDEQMAYFPIYQEMDRQDEEIQKSFDALTIAAGGVPGGGARREKGRGRGKAQ